MMKQERMMILGMLENGKISAEEAEKLLLALKKSEPIFDKEEISDDLEERFTAIVKGFNSFAKDVGEKLDSAAKGVEPKLKKATKIVVEKTTSAIDEISKTMGDKNKVDDEQCCCQEGNKCDKDDDCCN